MCVSSSTCNSLTSSCSHKVLEQFWLVYNCSNIVCEPCWLSYFTSRSHSRLAWFSNLSSTTNRNLLMTDMGCQQPQNQVLAYHSPQAISIRPPHSQQGFLYLIRLLRTSRSNLPTSQLGFCAADPALANTWRKPSEKASIERENGKVSSGWSGPLSFADAFQVYLRVLISSSIR